MEPQGQHTGMRLTRRYRALRNNRGGERIPDALASIMQGADTCRCREALWDENPLIEFTRDQNQQVCGFTFDPGDIARIGLHIKDAIERDQPPPGRMQTRIIVNINADSYHQHAIEQDASVPELARNLKADALSAVSRLRLEALSLAIINEHECQVSVWLHDSYSEIRDDDEEAPHAKTTTF